MGELSVKLAQNSGSSVRTADADSANPLTLANIVCQSIRIGNGHTPLSGRYHTHTALNRLNPYRLTLDIDGAAGSAFRSEERRVGKECRL